MWSPHPTNEYVTHSFPVTVEARWPPKPDPWLVSSKGQSSVLLYAFVWALFESHMLILSRNEYEIIHAYSTHGLVGMGLGILTADGGWLLSMALFNCVSQPPPIARCSFMHSWMLRRFWGMRTSGFWSRKVQIIGHPFPSQWEMSDSSLLDNLQHKCRRLIRTGLSSSVSQNGCFSYCHHIHILGERKVKGKRQKEAQPILF